MSRLAIFWFAAAVASGLAIAGDRLLAGAWPVSPLYLIPLALAGRGLAFLRGSPPEEQRGSGEPLFQRIVESAPTAVIVVDRQGNISLVNSQAENLFGYGRLDLLGQPMEMLVPERYRVEHLHHRSHFFEVPAARSMGAGRDLFCLRKDGREVAVEIGLNPLETESGPLVLASIIDITQRKKAEQRLRDSLREKELLLQEIHHRVKNNLAVISSMFFLQTGTTDNPEAIAILRDCRERVRSMALVHERLYKAEDLASVDFGDYAAELARQLQVQYALEPGQVRMNIDCSSVRLGIDKAIPCGLILTELLSNALRHAFPAGRNGTIDLGLEVVDGSMTLRVADDGVGMPPDKVLVEKKSLGMRLLRSLAQQVAAQLEIDGKEPGTRVRLTLEV